MALGDLFKLYKVRFFPSDAGAEAVITSVDENDARTEVNIERNFSAGIIYAESTRAFVQSIPVSFRTFNIKQGFDAIGSAPRCFESTTGKPGLELYYSRVECAGNATGDLHLRYTISKGIIWPQNLVANHGENATLQFGVVAAFDGTNVPIKKDTITDVILGASGSSGDRWGMHIGSLNGSPWEAKTNIDINWNVDTDIRGADGEDFPSFAGLSTVAPTVRVRGLDPNWLDSVESIDDAGVGTPFPSIYGIPVQGKSIAAGNHNLVLRRFDQTTNWITIAFQGFTYFPGIVSARQNQPAEIEAQVECVQEGATLPITVDTSTVGP